MRVFNKNRSLSDFLESLSTQNFSLGFVPTMGALHDGHLSLIRQAIDENDHVVVSIYINPTQFDDNQDLYKYPCNLEEDIEILKTFKNEKLSLFTPSNFEIYGKNISKDDFSFKGLDQHMEGKFRPGHFAGVATVVKKLLEVVRPNKAYFGEKDYQQLFLIKKMVKDLNLGVKIIGIPTVRDINGLALSSRNKLLNAKGLEIAKQIYLNIKKIRYLDYKHTKDLELYLKKELKKSGLNNIEYLEIRDANSLVHPKKIIKASTLRVFIAVYVDNVRLIDNYKLN